MDEFLKKYKLLKLTQYEIDHLNSPETIKGIEFIFEYSLKKKCLGPDSFTGELYQVFKEKLTSIYKISLRKQNRRKHFPTHCIKAVFA